MSRYGFPDRNGLDVVIGWDRPMATFFVQAEFDADGEPSLWLGASPGEIPTVEDLDRLVYQALGMHVPQAILAHLSADL